VQSFAVKTLLHLSDSPSRFALGAFLLNGYGVPSDAEHGLECLVQAASQGHAIAQAYLYRMFMACQKEIPPEIPVLDYLKAQARNGSRLALLDLKVLEPQQAKHTRELLKYGYGGVGSNWFHEDQWLQGLTQPKLMSKDFALDCLGPRTELQEVVVNIHGDRIIHAAAAVGAYGLIQKLLTDIKIDVNQRNAKGETALLCACRSGHPDMVKLLLDSGAQASIQSTSGESPLHWLVSFDENINPAAIGKDLIERGGASVHAFTTQCICHSVFPGSIDVDFQAEGTPLMWAVHDNKLRLVSFLLSMGADPNWRFQNKGLSPLYWAAFYHYSECLKMMVDHLERTIDTPMTTEGKKDHRYAVIYGPLVQGAVHASDKFSMILRNGANYLSQFKSTLAFLQEKTKLVRFSMGCQNETLLHFAAREAHDEACEIILESRWRIEELDQPVGPAGLTPLLESVRWNRRALFHLLRKHGANAQALTLSPYDEHARTWSALHIFAEQAHNDELGLVDDLLAAKVPVDGDPAHAIETPFNIAVRRNAFRLADCLLRHGASLHATSTRSSLIVSPHPLTGLGHIVALNARYSFNGLRYMLGPHEAATPEAAVVGFVVEPARGLSALHLCALVPYGLVYVGSGEALTRGDFDWETNRAIVHELLEWFREPGQLDLRCQMQGKTALHLAAEYGNIGVAEELVKVGADKSLRCEMGETPADIARRVFAQKEILSKLLAWLE
jgi:ankyrin repeat protein